MKGNGRTAQRVSLAEAWSRFCAANGGAFFDPYRSRPAGPPIVRDLVRDRRTGALVPPPIDGPDYGKGMIDWLGAERLKAAFRELIALPSTAYAESSDQPIAFEDWWWDCEPHLIASYVFSDPSLRDGYANSWDAPQPGDVFPLAIEFDRLQFELAPFWPRAEALSNEDRARAVIRAAMVERGGFIGQAEGAEIARAAVPTVGRDAARKLVKELTGNDKPGPKGPRKNRAGKSA